MSEQREIERVLAALDAGTGTIAYGDAMADAARAIRELALDFEDYAWHAAGCRKGGTVGGKPADCDCGLDAAHARWRIRE